MTTTTARPLHTSAERRAPREAPRSLDAHTTFLDTSASGTLACYQDDRGEGPPLLLLHSVNAAASAFEMRPLFEHYRGQRRVYALDLPGFGASSRDRADYTPARYAAAIERALIDVVMAETEPAIVVALSLACEFAARVASRSPDLVRGLAYISPTGLGSKPAEGARAHRLRAKVFGSDLVARAIFPLLSSRPSVRYFMEKSFTGRAPRELVDHAVATSHVDGARHAPAAFLAGALFTPDALRELYAKVSAPQVVIHGQDPYTDFGGVPALVAARPETVVHAMPTRGMAHWERTPQVAAAIDDLIEGGR